MIKKLILFFIIIILTFVLLQCNDYCLIMYGEHCSTETDNGFYTYYVSEHNGNDANPGTETLPFKTIQAAIKYAESMDNDKIKVKVAEGNYYTSIPDSNILLNGNINAHLFGSYPKDSWKDEDRDTGAYSTNIIDKSVSPENQISVIEIRNASNYSVIIDGFNISIPKTNLNTTIAINILNSSPVIRNNNINTDNGNKLTYGIKITGISEDNKSALLINNKINISGQTPATKISEQNKKGYTTESTGLYIKTGDVLIYQNEINGGNFYSYKTNKGIYLRDSKARIINNKIYSGNGGGISRSLHNRDTVSYIGNDLLKITNEEKNFIKNPYCFLNNCGNLIRTGEGTETYGIHFDHWGDTGEDVDVKNDSIIENNQIFGGFGINKSYGIYNFHTAPKIIRGNDISSISDWEHETHSDATAICNSKTSVNIINNNIKSPRAYLITNGIYNYRVTDVLISGNTIVCYSSEFISNSIYNYSKPGESNIKIYNNKITPGNSAILTTGIRSVGVESIEIINNIIDGGYNNADESISQLAQFLLEHINELTLILSGSESDYDNFLAFSQASTMSIVLAETNAKIYNNTLHIGLANYLSYGIVAMDNSISDIENNIIFSLPNNFTHPDVIHAESKYSIYSNSNSFLTLKYNNIFVEGDLTESDIYNADNMNTFINPDFENILGDDQEIERIEDNNWRLKTDTNPTSLFNGAINGALAGWVGIFPENENGYMIDLDGNIRPYPPTGWTMGAYQQQD
jgi:hypothetical protein